MEAKRKGKTTPIMLSFECKDLPNLDVITKTDPLIVLSGFEAGGWVIKDSTEVIYNSLNPKFSKPIRVEFGFAVDQRLKVEVYHQESKDKEVLIGMISLL